MHKSALVKVKDSIITPLYCAEEQIVFYQTSVDHFTKVYPGFLSLWHQTTMIALIILPDNCNHCAQLRKLKREFDSTITYFFHNKLKYGVICFFSIYAVIVKYLLNVAELSVRIG